MKDYITLTLSVNVAVILAKEIIAAIVLPIFIGILLSTNFVGDNPNAAIWSGYLVGALIVFLSSYWVFKLTYGNMRKMAKPVTLKNSVLYSVILFAIVNVLLSYSADNSGYVAAAIATAAACLGFYLAGSSVDKKMLPGMNIPAIK